MKKPQPPIPMSQQPQSNKPRAKHAPVLPLDQVIPDTKPHHVSVDIIDESVAAANRQLETFKVELAKAEKQVRDSQSHLENLKTQYYALDNTTKSFQALRARIAQLDVEKAPVETQKVSETVTPYCPSW